MILSIVQRKCIEFMSLFQYTFEEMSGGCHQLRRISNSRADRHLFGITQEVPRHPTVTGQCFNTASTDQRRTSCARMNQQPFVKKPHLDFFRTMTLITTYDILHEPKKHPSHSRRDHALY